MCNRIGKTRFAVAASFALYCTMSSAAAPAITGVTAQQRYPWNGKADISYTVTGDIAAEAKQRAVFTSPREFAAHDRGEYDALECHFCGELTYDHDNFTGDASCVRRWRRGQCM